MPQNQQSKQPRTSGRTQEFENSPETIQAESTSSTESLGVPTKYFKRYLGTASPRYVQIVQTSTVQDDNKWDLEETIRQTEPNFTTDLKTIATETTNNKKLLKPLVWLERRTLEQDQEEYKPYQKQLSTSFGVLFYDHRVIIPKALDNNYHYSS